MRQVNLLPQDMQQADRINFMRKAGLVLFTPVIVLLIIGHILLQTRLGYLKRTSEQPLAFTETQETRELGRRKKEARKKIRDFYAKNENVIEKFVKKFSVAHMLKSVGQIAAEKVWLQSMVLDIPKDVCRIKGKSFNTRLVSEFMLELKRLPYFQNVELVSMSKGQVKDVKEIEFQVVCRLK